MEGSIVFRNWKRLLFYSYLVLVVSAAGYLSFLQQRQLGNEITQNELKAALYQRQTAQVRALWVEYQKLRPKIKRVDPQLPGVSTSQLNFLLTSFHGQVRSKDYQLAQKTLNQLSERVQKVLDSQKLAAAEEIKRLNKIIDKNQQEIGKLLGNQGRIPADFKERLSDSEIDQLVRLKKARTWVKETANEIKRRRAKLATAQKQILIDKSELKLTMLEDGEPIYSMPISLGRPGWGTRTGNFEVLDKLGTVWSVWDIWLPYWIGIYFAGASENGIHGLPYDNAGNIYWKESIGKANVTFGCVMPLDKDMIKLYNWAEVGIPVAIVR